MQQERVTFTIDIYDEEINRIFITKNYYVHTKEKYMPRDEELEGNTIKNVYGMIYTLKTDEEIRAPDLKKKPQRQQGVTLERAITEFLKAIKDVGGYDVEYGDNKYSITPRNPKEVLRNFQIKLDRKPPSVAPVRRKLTRSEIEENKYQNSVLAIGNKIKRLSRELQLPKNNSKREKIQAKINELRYDLKLMEEKRLRKIADDARRVMGGMGSKTSKNYKNRRWRASRYGGASRGIRRGGKKGYGGGRGRLFEELKF